MELYYNRKDSKKNTGSVLYYNEQESNIPYNQKLYLWGVYLLEKKYKVVDKYGEALTIPFSDLNKIKPEKYFIFNEKEINWSNLIDGDNLFNIYPNLFKKNEKYISLKNFDIIFETNQNVLLKINNIIISTISYHNWLNVYVINNFIDKNKNNYLENRFENLEDAINQSIVNLYVYLNNFINIKDKR